MNFLGVHLCPDEINALWATGIGFWGPALLLALRQAWKNFKLR